MEETNNKIFECEICNYTTPLKNNFTRHTNSKAHKINTGELKEEVKEEYNKYCTHCKITIYDRSNWNKHIATKKHKQNETGIILKDIVHNFQCCWCPYENKVRNSYIKHMVECNEKPKAPIVIKAGIKGIKLQLEKLNDKVYPRYVQGNYTTRDPEVIKEMIIKYEKRLEDETKKYNDALINPITKTVEEYIKEELERNKCYKQMRDDEFDKLIEKAYEQVSSSEDEQE